MEDDIVMITRCLRRVEVSLNQRHHRPHQGLVAALPLLLLLVWLPLSVASVATNTTATSKLLLDFFEATNGAKWTLGSSNCSGGSSSPTAPRQLWNIANATGVHVCSWFGVACDATGTVVSSVTLNGCGLSGTLPASLYYYSLSTSTAILSLALNSFEVSNNGITGSLPPSYGAWGSWITLFHVSNNRLTGSLPPSYSAWVNMVDFSVTQNHISGTIPSPYQSWTHIAYFTVFENSLSGILPTEFSNWGTSVKIVLVSNNALTGTLPSSFSAWTNLTRFEFYNNAFSGSLPREYAAWTQLQQLIGFFNSLTGTLPPEYGSAMTQLTSLELSDNSLSGTIPATYTSASGMCRSLQVLLLHYNQLSGDFLFADIIKHCTQLQQLYVHKNSLTGAIFEATFHNSSTVLPHPLQILSVGENKLSGTIPNGTQLATCFPSITEFSIFTNNFSGTVPVVPVAHWVNISLFRVDANNFTGDVAALLDGEVSKLPFSSWQCRLESFYIFNNPGLNGSLPQSLGQCTSMTYFFANGVPALSGTFHNSYVTAWATSIKNFSVRQANLTGTVPPAVATWTNLLSFDIGFNHFTGPLSSFVTNPWPVVELFRLSNNSFYGTLPTAIILTFKSLRTFYVNLNNISGTLSPSYSSWTDLTEFDVSNNSFTGTLPAEWSNWGASITKVSLQSNQLSGSLPPQWAQWVNVQSVLCNGNMLTGPLPTSWGSFPHLGTLFLNQNSLSGTLPSAWSGLSSLLVLDVSGNNLSGTLPDSWGSLKFAMLLSLQGNKYLYGSIPSSWSVTPPLLFRAVSIYMTQLYGSTAGISCFPCFPPKLTLTASTVDEAIALVLYYCNVSVSCSGPQTQGPTPAPSNNAAVNVTQPTIPQSDATIQMARNSLGVSVAASAAAAAIAGDPSSAQMLITLLLSTCMCSDGSGGVLSSSSDEGVLAAVVTSLTLSPFASLGPAAMAFGNAGLVCAAFVVQLLLVVLLGRRRRGGGGRRRDREEIAANVRPVAGRRDAGGATVLDLVAWRWRALCVSPAAVAARFPNVAVVCGVFLVPGMVRGAVVVLGTAGRRGALEVVGAVVSVAVLCVFLVAVLEWLVYRTVVLEDVARSAGGAAGGGVLREDEPLHFEAYATPHPFTPPVPALVAAAAMSRGGAWVPAGKRNSFGRLVAALGPSHTRWWVVPPAMTVLTTLLSSLPTTSTGGCDALQGMIGAACGAAALAFVAVRPYRAVGASAVAAYSLVVVGATAVLGLACRHDALRLGQVLSICSALSYVSLVGRVYVMALPFVEQRLLEGQFHALAGRRDLPWASTPSPLLTAELLLHGRSDAIGRIHNVSERRRMSYHGALDEYRHAALAELIAHICSRHSTGGGLV